MSDLDWTTRMVPKPGEPREPLYWTHLEPRERFAWVSERAQFLADPGQHIYMRLDYDRFVSLANGRVWNNCRYEPVIRVGGEETVWLIED